MFMFGKVNREISFSIFYKSNNSLCLSFINLFTQIKASETIGERATSGRQIGVFFLYACFGTNITTFQKEIPSQTVKIK